MLADKVNARTAASVDLFNEMIADEKPDHFVDDSSTVQGKLWCFDDRLVINEGGSANVNVRAMGSSDGDGLPVRPTSYEDMKWSPDSRAIALQ
ncbi:unnamed protein product [Phytophthora lilii]|uniref:Unnamed protein product n=1 Tax=Phytophthora lilii TaxID=2077276 RepID=A0A9W6TGW8_9STRA|nr:unnamed protein product [Phytophthora lilii]